jgi:hypothetical protein
MVLARQRPLTTVSHTPSASYPCSSEGPSCMENHTARFSHQKEIFECLSGGYCFIRSYFVLSDKNQPFHCALSSCRSEIPVGTVEAACLFFLVSWPQSKKENPETVITWNLEAITFWRSLPSHSWQWMLTWQPEHLCTHRQV